MFNKRSLFLINKDFQLRFAFYVVSWLIPISLVYPFIIYKLFDLFIRYIIVDLSGPALVTFESTKHQILWLLIALQLLFLLVTFFISIFMSHRIAGPLYKLQKSLEETKKGNFALDVKFRKGDHFADLADDFNEMIRTVRGLLTYDATKANEAATQIEKVLYNVDPQSRKTLEEAMTTLRGIRHPTRTQ